MNSIRVVFLFISIFIVQGSFSQKKKSPKLSKADNLIVTNLQAHIGYLADDKLEGRRAGTNGEKLAGEYISQKFRETGLQPKGSDGFFQSFEIYDGKQINTATHFIINAKYIVDLPAELIILNWRHDTQQAGVFKKTICNILGI